MAKAQPVHHDKLGNLLVAGDVICYPDSNSLVLGTVIKLNPKMVGVQKIGSRLKSNKYPDDVIKLEGDLVTFYLLKNQK